MRINLKTLPENVQTEILETLKYFTRCHVTLKVNGGYDVSIGLALLKDYNSDKYLGYFDSKDYYTREQINSFWKISETDNLSK